MIFADKLIQLRKKSGWSQEELAEQMNVTRQSVSKWEGAQSIPDLEKIVRLSELFGVSTDYLLKDEMEEEECSCIAEEVSSLRHVSMEEASAFLAVKAATSKTIAYGTFLCILSPICLLLLGAISESPEYSLSDNAAGGIGMLVLLMLVAIAVVIFISSGNKTASFEYLEKEIFETEYGVDGMVRKQKEEYRSTYTKYNIIGSCMCIMSLMPLFIGIVIDEENELFMVFMLSLMLVIVAVGVVFFVQGGVIWSGFEALLQEGDYSKWKKQKQTAVTAISKVYWLTVTAIYLAYSLASDNWKYSWIIWAVAGVLFPAVIAVVNVFGKKEGKTQ